MSVGIFAHDEEHLISQVAFAFCAQRVDLVEIAQIVIVTPVAAKVLPAVEQAAAAGVPIEVLEEPRRRGKLAAINDFLALATGDIVIVASGDTFPDERLVERLCAPIVGDAGIGMTGPRVVQHRASKGLIGRANEVLWELHDLVAQERPKLGEIVAVRRSIVPSLPEHVYCDEVVMEALTTKAGYRLAYVREATATNVGLTSWRALFSQRRRIHCQHLYAEARLGYAPATVRPWPLAAVVGRRAAQDPRVVPALVAMCALELAARVLAARDYRRGRDYRVWDPTSAAQLASAPGAPTAGIPAVD